MPVKGNATKIKLFFLLALLGLFSINLPHHLTSSLDYASDQTQKSSIKSRVTGQEVRAAAVDPVWNVTWFEGGFSDDDASGIWIESSFMYTTGKSNNGMTLVKWDSNGNQLWNRSCWAPGDWSEGIWGDGTYLYTTGATFTYGAGGADLTIEKWDLDGNRIWNYTWGTAGNDYGYDIWGDGTSLWTVGYTYAVGGGSSWVNVVKWDSNGNNLKNCTYSGSDYNDAWGIWGNESAFYTCGRISTLGDDALLLLKWNLDGTLNWSRTWGGLYDMHISYNIWGQGAFIYCCGYTNLNGYDLLLVKFDSNGNEIWNRTWGGVNDDRGYSVWGDTQFLYTCGFTMSFTMGGKDLLLVKWDLAGNQIWNRTWGYADYDVGGACVVNDNFVYVCGFTETQVGGYAMVIVKWSTSTVLDITHPADLPIEFGTIGNNLSWSITTLNTNGPTYEISVNGSLNGSGPWSPGVPINISLNGLAIGLYNYSISATDGLDGAVQDDVWVTVVADNALPTVSHPLDKEFNFGTIGQSISWTITDPDVNTPTFTISIDSIENLTGVWISGVPVQIFLDGLGIGTYNVSIIASDGYGGIVQDDVLVVVKFEQPSTNISFTDLTMLVFFGGIGFIICVYRKKKSSI